MRIDRNDWERQDRLQRLSDLCATLTALWIALGVLALTLYMIVERLP